MEHLSRAVCIVTKPTQLIHYSESDISLFNQPVGHFKVSTQGRVYTVELDARVRGFTTKSMAPVSALIFTGAALSKFERHTWKSTFVFKRWLGQYWTKGMGDVTWQARDTLLKGCLLEILDVEIVPIKPSGRHLWQSFKVAVTLVVDSTCLAAASAFIVWCVMLKLDLTKTGLFNFLNNGIGFFMDLTIQYWFLIAIPFGVLLVLAIRDSIRTKRKKTTAVRDDLIKYGYLQQGTLQGGAAQTLWQKIKGVLGRHQGN